MGLLLPYNLATSYSFEDLENITGMSSESLGANIALLLKAKVLTESSPKKYDLNMDFKSKKVKINLNIAIKSEAKADIEDTHKTIEKDRELVIQVLFIELTFRLL